MARSSHATGRRPWKPRHRPHDNPYLGGNYAPLRAEYDLDRLAVTGRVPDELAGAFYYIGPNPQFEPFEPYVMFEGDGMVHAFSIRGGEVSYKNRWVRTRRFVAERAAGRALFGLAFTARHNRVRDVIALTGQRPLSLAWNVLVKGDSQSLVDHLAAANTSLIPDRGEFLATFEPTPPVRLCPKTLATGHMERFGKSFSGAFTAHPKRDRKTGELFGFGNCLPGRWGAAPSCRYYIIDASGRMIRDAPVTLPHATMMHDFVVTERHVMFLVFPVIVGFDPRTGVDLRWRPRLGTRLGVMPRYGPTSALRWIELDPCYAFHVMNAWSEADRIVVDVARLRRLPEQIMDPEVELDLQLDDPAYLTRWEVDVRGARAREIALDRDHPCEFPRFDDRFGMARSRVGFVSALVGEGSGEWLHNSVIRYDLDRDARAIHCFGAARTCSEAVFVPRSPDAAEGDGYVMTLVYDVDTDRSDLVILDAERLGDEPLATVHLPHRVPNGFHATWLDAAS